MSADHSNTDDVAPDPNAGDEDAIVKQAKDRFKRCQTWYSLAHKNWRDDWKFFNADATNGYQWPNQLRKNRDVDERPCLTINKTRQHVLQIVNDAKQNKPGVTIRPTGNGATYEAAQCWMGLVRHIEYISDASETYDLATLYQVAAGCGYIRVVPDYKAPDSFDQEIYIRPVKDPLSVFLDPDAKMAAKGDARFAFVFEDISKEALKKRYPRYSKYASQGVLNNEGWTTEDMVKIVEYFRIKEVPDRLVQGPGWDAPMLWSKIPEELRLKIREEEEGQPGTYQFRPTQRKQVEWFLIIGEKVADRKDFPCKYIPIVPVVGEETIIDGVMDCRGHTRSLTDPQRMYNYWTSAAVEFVALQGKSPYIAPAEAIEGYEEYWNSANRVNHSVLPYRGVSDEGEPITPPQKIQPPTMAPAYLQGMQVAANEMMMVSGQYQAEMGQQGNERTGKAIIERQRQGENATYHYIDNLAIGIKQLGKIILDMAPRIYDVERMMMIQAENGTDLEIKLSPGAQKAYMEQLNEDNQVAQRVFSPQVGEYEVEADIGPAFATKREQGAEALMQIITQAPALTSIIGDVLLRNMDFPSSEEAAMRLRRMVPPQALGDGPTMAEQQLQQQVQQLNQALQKSMEALAESRMKLKASNDRGVVDAYNAETQRAKAIWDTEIAVGAAQQAAEQAQSAAMGNMQDMAGTDVNSQPGQIEGGQGPGVNQGTQPLNGPQGATNQPENQPGQDMSRAYAGQGLGTPTDIPPMQGASRGRDGRWYIKDGSRKGKYLMVG